MKFNFKKVASVFASAVMLSSTVGFAAAASYPEPFVSGGTADAAVVVGVNAAVSDWTSAIDVQSKLNALSTDSAGSDATVTGGDSFAIEKTSQKFWLGKSISDVASTNIDDGDMPELLADGKYTDANNEEYDYKQYVKLAQSPQYKLFDDNDYKKNTPSLGIKYSNNDAILNYTLEMVDKPKFTAIADSTLPLMGKEYYVLSTSSNTTLTLLDSASSAVLSEGETRTLDVDGKSYEVAVDYVDSSGNVRFTVNGETTDTLDTTSAKTYRLSDGAYIGLKTALAQSYAGGTSTVEFSIGSGKLVIEDTKKVKLNDENVDNVYGYVENSSNTKLSKVIIQWKADDEKFVAEDSSITMPSFEALKLSYAGFSTPSEESFTVKAGGNDYIVLDNFPIQGGTIDIPILAKADGDNNFSIVGEDSDNLILTSASSSITYNSSLSGNQEYQYAVVSWTDGTATSSHLIRPDNYNNNSGTSEVDIEQYVNGAWETLDSAVTTSDELDFGDFTLTVDAIGVDSSNEYVTLSYTGTETSFNTLYTDEGLKVVLPWINDTAVSPVSTGGNPITCANAAANITATYSLDQIGEIGYSNINVGNESGSGNITCTYYPTNNDNPYNLSFTEENKDGDIASGWKFNVTISNTGSSDYDATVSGTSINGTEGTDYSGRYETSESDVYVQYIYSPLATKFLEDDSGTQDTVQIMYNSGESYGEFFLTSSDATITPGTGGSSGSGGQVLVVKDTEVNSVSDKNLFVVGGSCINSVAAEILGSDSPLCGSDFTDETGVGSGQYIIKSIESPYNAEKIAMLVAGYEAADTTKAVEKALEGATTDSGTEQVYPMVSA